MLNIHIENNVNSNYSLRGHKKNRVPQKEKNYKSNVIYQRESEKKDIVTQLFVHVGVYKQIR